MTTARGWLVRSMVASALVLSGGMAQAALSLLLITGSGTSSVGANSYTYNNVQFVWDSTLGVTWLRNASLGGTRNWDDANTWANNLSLTVAGPGGSVTYSDWALPTATEIPPTAVIIANDGSGDGGYNITRTSSQLSHLYYDAGSLNNKGFCNVAGTCPNPAGYGLTNTAPFVSLQQTVYWSGTAYSPFPSSFAWAFNANNGLQGFLNHDFKLSAWAVHPGQLMAPVPEPHEWAMMLAGLGVVGGMARVRRRLGASGA